MIRTDFKDETLDALRFIISCQDEFIVCGSRYFGDAKPNSDYDFVTEDVRIYDFLITQGWECSKSEKLEYLDSNTLHVIGKAKVQIIIAKSLSRRVAAREWIVANGRDRHKTESWDDAYNNV